MRLKQRRLDANGYRRQIRSPQRVGNQKRPLRCSQAINVAKRDRTANPGGVAAALPRGAAGHRAEGRRGRQMPLAGCGGWGQPEASGSRLSGSEIAIGIHFRRA